VNGLDSACAAHDTCYKNAGLSWFDNFNPSLSSGQQSEPPTHLSIQTHKAALEIAAQYGYHIYDALILAAALDADCDTLYSEDMQSGQTIGALTIRNPF
jgi:hypothetical protein